MKNNHKEMNTLIITHGNKEMLEFDSILLNNLIGKKVIGYETSVNEKGIKELRISYEAIKAEEIYIPIARGEGKSKYRGVYWDKTKSKWRAEITIKGHKIRLGRFDSESKAAIAYDRANFKHRGFNGHFNFPETIEYLFSKDIAF